MKKWLKIVTGIMLALIVLLVVLVVLANVLITPERVKATLLPMVEKNLDRKVELGTIEASLFSGIAINGLKVYERDGTELFLSTDLVRMKYQLLPLLAMKVVVDEVRLVKPSIRLVRFEDGHFNFDDLATSDTKEQPTDPSQSVTEDNDDKGSPISLLISQVLLEDGQLVFLDHLLNRSAPYRFEINSLQVAAAGVTLSGAVPVSLQCRINGGELNLKGQMNLQSLGGDFTVSLQNLDLVAFKPYFKEALPGTLGALKLNLEAKLSGTVEKLDLQGSLSLADLDLVLDALPAAAIKKATLNTVYNLQLDRQSDRLQLRQLDLDYNGVKVSAQGEVLELTGDATVDLQVSSAGVQIRQAIDAAPKGLLDDVIALDPAGKVSFASQLSGPVSNVSKLLKTATIDLDSVQATVSGHRPALSGRLRLNGEQLDSENLQLRMGDNHADIKLNASRVISGPRTVIADLTSERFLLDPLLQGGAASAAGADQAEAEGSADQDEEIGPFDIPLQAGGTIKIAETVWKGVAVEDFLASYQLKDNLLTLEKIDGRFAGGSFSNSARVDLGKKGFAYSARISINAVQADPLLSALLPKAAGSLFGAMDLSLEVDGKGTLWQTISRNLSGQGDMLVADGRLSSPALVSGLSTALQVPELSEISFDDFTGRFTIDKGKLKLDSQMSGRRLKIFPKGTIGLDGSLNLGLDTRISPDLSARLDKSGGVTRYLADQDGWTQVPLLLKGSFSSPSFGLDPQGIKSQASKAIGNELGRQLDKILQKSAPAKPQGAPASPDDKSSPADKLIQDSLKNLFGN